MVPENQGIYSDDDGYHHYHVKHGNHRFCHTNLPGLCSWSFTSPDKDFDMCPLVGEGAHPPIFLLLRCKLGIKVQARYQAVAF